MALTYQQAQQATQGLTPEQIAARAQTLAPVPQPQAQPLPTAPTQTAPALNSLEQQYQGLLSPGKDELQAQTDLNNLIASTRQGYTNIDNKVIPMEFITGQARALEQRSTDLAIPLQQRLALAQSKRQSGLEATRFALERSDRQSELAREQLRMAQAQQADARDFALKNNITQPFYMIGNTIYRTSDNKAYSTPEQFFADGGAQDFSGVQKLEGSVGADKLLSPTEAARLGVPYGTTQQQAASMSITPSFGRTSSGGSGGSSGSSQLPASDAAIRNWILANKRENSGMAYYDLWGQLSEELKAQGLNPSNYDKIFWELLHPEGLQGYAIYKRQ